MYRIEHAVILAAGLGTRMRVLTEETPKAMLKVNGQRIIDSILQALKSNGISDIVIVTGHRKERFREVVQDYPHVCLVENPYYEDTNNISSLYCVRDFLSNTMVIEGDLLFHSPEPLAAEYEHSEYNGFWLESNNPEWIVFPDKEGKITGYELDPKRPGWTLCGVSRWTPEDGRKLRDCLEREFDVRHNRDIYWDYLPLEYYKEMFPVYLRGISPDAQTELDCLEEIARLDPVYRKYLD